MSSIRQADLEDFDRIWPFFRQIAAEGKTYSYPTDLSKETAAELWLQKPQLTFVCQEGSEILGSYYIKPNALGPGSHVCNCGYMVLPAARGKGIATSMCEHSQRTAVDLGFKAMQFNSVVSTNTGAVKLWQRLGFETVGRLPGAFKHPELGYVDCLVMYKWLVETDSETN